jgi:hypothetical protein
MRTKTMSASFHTAARILGSLAVGALAAACTPEQLEEQSRGESENVATAAQGLSSGTYQLKNVNSNMCIDVAGSGTSDGTKIQQWACGTGNNQKWTVTNLNDNNRHRLDAVHSGKTLHATKGSCGTPSSDASPARLFQDINYGGAIECFQGGTDYSTLPHDNWATSVKLAAGFRMRLYENGSYGGASLYRSGSDGDLVPDGWNDRASSVKVFTKMQQAAWNGSTNQKWLIEGTGPYTIKLAGANQCVEVENSSTSNGAQIQSNNCTGANNQKWTFVSTSGSGPTWSSASASGGIPQQNFDSIDWGIFETGNGTFSENACRFVPSQVGVYGGYLYLKAEAGFVAGGWSSHENANVGDRWCKSGELRTKAKFGPYGKISARMRSPDRAGSNPDGKVGFIHSLFTFRTPKSDRWREIDIELTGLKPRHQDTNLITTVAGGGCMSYDCTSNSQSSVWVNSNYWSTGQWHDYMVDWRSQSLTWYVDGAKIRTLNRSQFSGPWPTESAEILMNFWLPQHSIESSFGGKWVDGDIQPTDYFEGHYDWFKFERCTSGC